MSEFKLPAGHNTVMPYLILPDAMGFLEFVEDVFGGKRTVVHLTEEGKIMHAELRIGESTLMVGNSSEEWKTSNSGLYVNVPEADATYANALAAGARSVLEMSDMPYGRSGGVMDPFGNVWWITTP